MTDVISYFNREQMGGAPKCPIDPYYIVPDKCKCVDFQVCNIRRKMLNCPVSILVLSKPFQCGDRLKTFRLQNLTSVDNCTERLKYL